MSPTGKHQTFNMKIFSLRSIIRVYVNRTALSPSFPAVFLCVILFFFLAVRQLSWRIRGIGSAGIRLAVALQHISPLYLSVTQDGGDCVGVPLCSWRRLLFAFVPLHCCALQMTVYAMQSVTSVVVGGCLFWPCMPHIEITGTRCNSGCLNKNLII